MASGQFLLHGTFGRAIEIKACLAEAALLQSGKLSAADALTYRAQLQKLPPLAMVADHLGHGDRMLFLGFATELAQKQQPELEDMLLSISPVASPEFIIDLLNGQMSLIWSEGMRSLNNEWDRWVAVAATPLLPDAHNSSRNSNRNPGHSSRRSRRRTAVPLSPSEDDGWDG